MEKQKKLKFNLVDVIFILVLLAGAAFVALRLGGLDVVARFTGAHTEEYVITFVGTEAPDYVVDRLEIGAPVTDDSLDLNMGTLVDFKAGPSLSSGTAADGHIVMSSREGYKSVYLMCKMNAADNGFGVTVDGQKLGVGHSMVVRAGDAKLWMVVYDIQKLDDSPYAGQ